MSDQIADPTGTITETKITIDPSVVPDWLRTMWGKALKEG